LRKDHYFKDFAVGLVFGSKPVCVDKARVVAFAQEFDPQPQHLSEQAASATHFGQPVAGGWHAAAISMSLFMQNLPRVCGGTQGVGVDSIAWSRPVRPGDQSHVETEITTTRVSPSRPDKGLVTVRDRTFNQHGEVVQTISHIFMAPRRTIWWLKSTGRVLGF
jgi:acyl dehydratase